MRISRGDAVIVPKDTVYWYRRSLEELDAVQQRDAAAGRFTDSAGETIIYSVIGSGRLSEDLVGIVTRLKDIKWPTWHKKPKHAIECIVTISGLPRYVIVQSTNVRKDSGETHERK